MKLTILLALALAPAWAQLTKVASAPAAAAPGGKPLASRQAFQELEGRFDATLSTLGGFDRVDLRGYTRGLYVEGFGAIITAEVDLAPAPPLNPFHQVVTPAEKAQVHQRKVTNLAALKKAMREMMTTAANKLPAMPGNDQIVLAVRLAYQTWEDTSGLPNQILMRADRKSAAGGNVQVEEQ